MRNSMLKYIMILGGMPGTLVTYLHMHIMTVEHRYDFAVTAFYFQFIFWTAHGRSWMEFAASSVVSLSVSWTLIYFSGHFPFVFDVFWNRDFSYLITVLAIWSVVYYFIERLLKELWVDSDTNNKSFGIFKNMLESQPNPSLLLDKNGRILFWNKSASKLILKRRDKPIHTIYDLVHETSKEIVDSLLAADKSQVDQQPKYIGILQNITEGDLKDNNMDSVGNLIIEDKLTFYKAESKFG